MSILAIDPGEKRSGWCVLSSGPGPFVESVGIDRNEDLADALERGFIRSWRLGHPVAIEYPMPYATVPKSVIATAVWSGVFLGAISYLPFQDEALQLITRSDVRSHLCGAVKGIGDAQVNQAVRDRLGPKPTKKNPNPNYWCKPGEPKGDMWAAIAVALVAYDRLNNLG